MTVWNIKQYKITIMEYLFPRLEGKRQGFVMKE